MMDVDDDDVTLQQFIRKCQKAAGRISQQVANRNANKNTGRNSNNNNQSNANKNTGSSNTGSGSNSSSTPRLTDAEKANLMKEGKCFYCREQGHVSRSCPKKKKDPSTTLVSANPEKSKAAAELEAAKESDSGKESA